MDFPDIKSLKFAAKVHKFREQQTGESETDYRKALSDHVKPIDRIESFEIRFGKGWDKWNDQEKMASLFS